MQFPAQKMVRQDEGTADQIWYAGIVVPVLVPGTGRQVVLEIRTDIKNRQKCMLTVAAAEDLLPADPDKTHNLGPDRKLVKGVDIVTVIVLMYISLSATNCNKTTVLAATGWLHSDQLAFPCSQPFPHHMITPIHIKAYLYPNIM